MTDTPPPYNGPVIGEPVTVEVVQAGPGPMQRIGRSVKQAVLGLLASIPVAAGALTAAGIDVDPKVTAIAVGVPTAAGVIVAAVWNLVDSWRGNG